MIYCSTAECRRALTCVADGLKFQKIKMSSQDSFTKIWYMVSPEVKQAIFLGVRVGLIEREAEGSPDPIKKRLAKDLTDVMGEEIGKHPGLKQCFDYGRDIAYPPNLRHSTVNFI